jgi:hypothetical protein
MPPQAKMEFIVDELSNEYHQFQHFATQGWLEVKFIPLEEKTQVEPEEKTQVEQTTETEATEVAPTKAEESPQQVQDQPSVIPFLRKKRGRKPKNP